MSDKIIKKSIYQPFGKLMFILVELKMHFIIPLSHKTVSTIQFIIHYFV